MIDITKIQHAAQVAATIPMRADGRGRYAIVKPLNDLIRAIEAYPENREMAVAVAKGSLETESHMEPGPAMEAWPVIDEIFASTTRLFDLVEKRREVTAAYVMAYRAASGEEDDS